MAMKMTLKLKNRSCGYMVIFKHGVIHKVSELRFPNFRPPSPCTCTYAFCLQPLSPPPSMSVRISFFKEDMTIIYFVNYYQPKNHNRYKIKKLL